MRSENDIRTFERRLEGKIAPKTIQNYRVAMRHYMRFIAKSEL